MSNTATYSTRFFSLLLLLWLLMLISLGCRRFHSMFETQHPRGSYLSSIKKSPLGSKPLAKQWQAAGDSVLHHPMNIEIPFQLKIVFFSDEARAWAWQFKSPEGRDIQIQLSRSDSSQRVFVDLFALKNGTPDLVESTKNAGFSFTPDQDQTFILRLQAELLVNGSATLKITDQPTLAFPVLGGTHADIGGVFGDPRAGGSRKHKGIDIFADRDTPALAVSEGRVSRTGNHGLGGKQVWLHAKGKAFYYAHLDSIIAQAGQQVRVGDTLGLIGNTGNARHSPPHLHFGIYEHGAIDPQPFVDFRHQQVEPVQAEPDQFHKWARIAAAKANVRPQPSTRMPPDTSLSRNDAVKITAGTGKWYQVTFPGHFQGFIYQTLVKAAKTPIGNRKINSSDRLFFHFNQQGAYLIPDSAEKIDIFAAYHGKALVQYKRHWMWVKK